MSSYRASSHKKQTRLSFTPAPSSSPQRSAAFVRVDEASSPAKKQRTSLHASSGLRSPSINASPTTGSPFSMFRDRTLLDFKNPSQLPTPQPSSQIDEAPEHGSNTEKLRNGHNSRTRTPGSTTGVNNADPLYAGNTTARNAKNRHATVTSSEDDKEISALTAQRKKFQTTKLSGGEDSKPVTPHSRRPRKAKTLPLSPASPTQHYPTRSKRPGVRSFFLGGSSGTAPISHTQGRKKSSPTRRIRRKVGSSSSDEEGSLSVGSTGDEATPNSSTHNLRSSAKTQTRLTRPKAHTSQETPELGDSSENAVVKKKRSPIVLITSDENESDVVATSGRRRRNIRRGGVSPEKESKHAEEATDLEDDLEDLRGTEIRDTRTRGRPAESERARRLDNLQELRRRRTGISEPEDDNSERASVEEAAKDTAQGEEEQLHESLKDLDEYEADFLDDDGEEPLGVDLARHGVPLEFTRNANLKPDEYFKYEVEWMVHNKLNPAFERRDEIYEISHKKLNDEFLGRAGSTYISTVWDPEFTKALKTRPELSCLTVATMLERKCEACNRSGHPPKHTLTFSGRPYDKDSLEPTSTQHEGENDSQSDSTSSDSEEPADQTFFLGRHCYGNAEIAHMLTHWRYQLNQTVLQLLALNGHTSPRKIVERENWNKKKREKLANRVVDNMVESGEMRELYVQFKQSLKAARDAKPERFSNGR